MHHRPSARLLRTLAIPSLDLPLAGRAAAGAAIGLLALAATLWPARLPAWTGTLEHGEAIRVDPETHRATRVDGDTSRPLWDGVHRLDDGSVVIVREGTAVPTQEMLDAWGGTAASEAVLAEHPCERLERRVCGRDNACRTAAACLSARSLRNAEREAQRRAPYEPGTRAPTAATARCEGALADPVAFPTCAADLAAAGPNPCRALADKVCGADNRCAATPACPPAQALLKQDTDERAASPDPAAPTVASGLCQEALSNAFFAPCE